MCGLECKPTSQVRVVTSNAKKKKKLYFYSMLAWNGNKSYLLIASVVDLKSNDTIDRVRMFQTFIVKP